MDYNINILIIQATVTRMIIISQRNLVVNRKDKNMRIILDIDKKEAADLAAEVQSQLNEKTSKIGRAHV